MVDKTPAPKRKKESKGLFAAIASIFAGEEEAPAKKKPQSRRRKSGGQDSRSRSGQRSRRRGQGVSPALIFCRAGAVRLERQPAQSNAEPEPRCTHFAELSHQAQFKAMCTPRHVGG